MRLREKYYYVQLIKMALPLIGAYILQTTYNLTDMLWVGMISSDAVAAVGTAGFYLHLAWAISSIITVGINIKTSHAVGERNFKKAADIATNGIFSIIILSVILSAIFYFNSESLVNFFKLKNQEVNYLCSQYLEISSLGVILSFTNLCFVAIFNGYGLTKLSFKASAIGTIANIVFDPLLIHVFDMGTKGAAWASIIARFLSILYFIYLFLKRNQVVLGRLKSSYFYFKEIVRIGAPSAVQRLAFSVIYIFLARIMANWGANALAVQKIGVQIEAILFMIIAGLMQATSIMTGHSWGADKPERIKYIFNSSIKMSWILGVVSGIVLWIFSEDIFTIFISEKESVMMGGAYLKIIAISQIFMFTEMICAGVYNGMGKTDTPAIVSVSITSLRIPIAYVLGYYTFLELDGVWWSISITSIIKGLLMYFLLINLFQKLAKKTNKPFSLKN
ncbi:MAG: MATE family efflux transporter [Marinifilaceae bacterium]|jgi:putative MATE family efflux protein|nr:MATE family efflux transporter [Marinifilaceae bacterium]